MSSAIALSTGHKIWIEIWVRDADVPWRKC